jgi:hypothetical protein
VRDVVLPVVAIRVGLLAIAGIAGPPLARGADLAKDLPTDVPQWLAVWDRWDGPHYLTLAAHGYDPRGDVALAAFFPLYPATIAAVSVVLPPLIAAMTISFVATLVASLALYELVRRDADDASVARRSVLAMNLFPTAFVLVAPYAEGLFLALSIVAFLAARAERWATAGVAGFLAALARVQGWLLGPALFVEAVAGRVWRPHRRFEPFVWAVQPFAAIAVFLAINDLAYGDPTFFLGQQADHFYHHLGWPWVVLGDLVRGVAEHTDPLWALIDLAPLIAYAFLAVVIVWAARSPRSRPAYLAYVLLGFIALASVTFPISAPRYVGALFPAFIALASLSDLDRRLWLGWLAVSTVGLVGFTINFVAGGWAF